MDYVKDAFQKVKLDILFLKEEMNEIKKNSNFFRQELKDLRELIKQNFIENSPTQEPSFQTPSTHPSTDKGLFTGLKPQSLPISTGNEGVPTDKQTNRQTDKPIIFSPKEQLNPIDEVSSILGSLDNIKKEVRLKFKRLTDQEFLVFSIIYQMSEDGGYTDYRAVSDKLNLTESSIRDYVGRLIKKGIPVEKNKINNKNIQLSISENLKKIATLPTILQLRSL